MEELLQGSLSNDPAVRDQAYQNFKIYEKTETFISDILRVSSTSAQDMKILSLIMLKNTINKSWIVKTRISDDDKVNIKDFLITNLETTGKGKELIIEAITIICKYEYLDTWNGLESYLCTVKQTTDYYKLLHSVIKTQLKKGSVRAKNNIKDLYQKIIPFLTLYLQLNDQIYLEKSIIKLISVMGSKSDIEYLLQRLNLYLITEGYHSYATVLLKGISLLIPKIPITLKDFIPEIYTIYLKVLHFVKPTTELNKSTLKYVFLGMKQALLKFPEFNSLLEDKSSLLLAKTFEIEIDERWELWNSGDFCGFLENTSESEDEEIRRFQESLLKSFPVLFSTIPSMMSQHQEFLQVHTLCNLLCILPKFPAIATENDYKSIMSWLSSLHLEGIYKLVVLRDSLIITRKWLDILTDLAYPFALLQSIKSSTTDPIILYECCLTLKQITYLNIGSDLLALAVQDFSAIAFQLIPVVQAPQSVWHLVTLISNFIDHSNSDENFIMALGSVGLRALLVDENIMIVSSVEEMLQKLIGKYPENKHINEAVALHISSRIMRKDKQVLRIWLMFLVNFKGELYVIDNLLPGIEEVNCKKLEFKTKILEEYLLIYYEKSCTEKIAEVTLRYCEKFCRLTGREEEDYLSLELIFCVIKVSSFDKSKIITEAMRYLNLEPLDVFHTLCIQYSLLIIATVLASNPELHSHLDWDLWIRKMKMLDTHNHLLLNCRGIRSVIAYASKEFIEKYSQEIGEFTERYANSLPLEENSSTQILENGLGVSARYKYYLFRA